MSQTAFSGHAPTTSCLTGDNNIVGCTNGIVENNSSTSNLIGDANRFYAAVTNRIRKATGLNSGGYTLQADASPTFGTVNAGTRSQIPIAVAGVEEGDTAI